VTRAITAATLLSRYPVLWDYLHRTQEDVLQEYVAEHARRPPGGWPSNPTAKKAVRLVELAPLEKALRVTAAFIDTLAEPEQRVLVAVWRNGSLGWFYVVRDTPYTWEECRRVWDGMTRRLEVRLRGAGVNLLAVRAGDVGLPLPLGGRREAAERGKSEND